MGNYNRQKIMLKGGDGYCTVAKITFSDDDMKVCIENVLPNSTLYFANTVDLFKIENDTYFKNADARNFALSIFCNEKIVAKYQCGLAKIDEQKIKNLTVEPYDDEQISDVNYYDNRLIGGLFEKQDDINHNAVVEGEHQTNTQESGVFNEKDDDAPISRPCEENSKQCYFERKRDCIERLFCHGKRLSQLENVIAESKFVTISHSENKSYVFGVIYNGGDAKYIAYGIKGSFDCVPQKLSHYNCFIPQSLFDFLGDGYYFLFQDAKSGLSIDRKIDNLQNL